MKTLLMILVSLIFIGIALFYILGVMSKSGVAIGIVDGQLAGCPGKPNCVCSEGQKSDHFIDPIPLLDLKETNGLVAMKKIVLEIGGKVETETDNYFSATFTSSLFRFIDDLEVRIDSEMNLIHMRSTSRVGYSDGGANRKRVEQIRKRLNQQFGD